MLINRQRRVRLSLSPLDGFLARVRRTLRLPEDAVTVCFVSDAAIARMNRSFRGKRGPTDVLSFPADGGKRGRLKAAATRTFLGDIAISPETARRNAKRFGRALPDELRILILHGALHLLGYDHETDRGEMNRLEARLRRRLGLR